MSKFNIHTDPAPAMVKATLYFGGNFPEPVAIPAGNEAGIAAGTYATITPAMFADFLARFITPQFPGFTVTTAEGYWKGKPEVVRMVTILAPDAGQFRATIRGFAEMYKTRFGQEAVAYDFTPCQFTLDCWPFGPVGAYHKPGLGY